MLSRVRGYHPNVVGVSSSRRRALRLVRKYRSLSERRRTSRKYSYKRLKQVVPTISNKDNISKLDVVLEAISYIHQLQRDLMRSMMDESSSN